MTNKPNRRTSFERRLAAYGAMSLAVAAVPAQAGIVSYSPDVTTPLTAPGGFITFNVFNGNATATSSAVFGSAPAPGSFGISFENRDLLTKAWSLVSSQNTSNRFAIFDSTVARLAENDPIGPSLNFSFLGSSLASNRTPTPFGNWNSFGDGYVGLSVTTSQGIDYGWAEIVVNDDYTVTLLRTGIDTTPGEAITAGETPAVPEPSSLMLLVMGGAGIAAWRRKTTRKQAATESAE